MEKFLFLNVIVSSLNIFVIVYAYSLNFFPKKWRKKVNQDTIVVMALIFCTMLTMFSWIVYFYLKTHLCLDLLVLQLQKGKVDQLEFYLLRNY